MQKNKELVVFDLDGTLSRSNTFHLFMKFSFKTMFFKFKFVSCAFLIFVAILRSLKIIDHKRMKFLIIEGTYQKLSDKDINLFYDSYIYPTLSQTVLSHLESWRLKDVEIVLATAAPYLYAKKIGEKLKINSVIATQRADNYDQFFECLSANKLGEVYECCGQLPIRAMYTDHPDDYPMLVKSQERYITNPTIKSEGWFEKNLGQPYIILKD